MKPERHIFLSYRSTEADFALRLAADLKNAGVPVWMDRLDINPGEDWPRALQKAVDGCSAMISVLSPGYIKSRYCSRELARADGHGTPIFPILLDPIPPADVPIEIQRNQYISFVDWENQDTYRDKLSILIEALESHLTHFEAIPPPEKRYLTSLIARLETHKAQEFTSLEPADELLQARPFGEDLWEQTDAFVLVQDWKPSVTEASQQVQHQKQPLHGIQEAIEQYPRFALVGQPGTGKSIILMRMVLEAAHRRLSLISEVPLPVMVDLADWTDESPLHVFIQSQYPAELREFSPHTLALYLDNLDVLIRSAPAKADQVRRWLSLDGVPDSIVLACRIDAYARQPLGLPVVLLEPMDEQRMSLFIANYMGDVAVNALWARVHPASYLDRTGQRHIFTLARLPFFLSALIAVYKRSTGNYPSNTAVMLQRTIEQLWDWYVERRSKPTIPYDVLMRRYADLAVALLDDGGTKVIERDLAMEYLGESETLHLGQQLHFIEATDTEVSFYHPLLRAYFAAQRIETKGVYSVLQRAAFDEHGDLMTQDWESVIMLMVGLASQPDPIMHQVAEVNPYLALHIMLDGVTVEEETYQEMVACLDEMLRKEPVGRMEGVRLYLRLEEKDRALHLLTDVLRQGGWPMRETARRVARRVTVPPMPDLVGALRDRHDNGRDDAADALHQLGDQGWPLLYQLLQVEPRPVRRTIIAVMGQVRDRAAVPALIEILNETDEILQQEAIYALGAICDGAALERIKDFLHHSNHQVARAAGEALTCFGAAAVPVFAQLLDDPAHNRRWLAIRSLGAIGGEQVTAYLVRGLEDPYPDVRAAAIEAVGSNKIPEDTIPLLLALLDDEAVTRRGHKRIADLARVVLRTSTDPRAIEKLNQGVTGSTELAVSGTEPAGVDDDDEEETDMSAALKDHPAQASAQTAKGRLQQQSDRKRKNARIHKLHQQLGSLDWSVRHDAVLALGQVGESALPLLENCAQDADENVRLAVVRALEHIATPPAIDVLAAMINDGEALVYDAAGQALARIGMPALPALLRALETDQAAPLSTAIEALGKVGAPEAIQPLARFLDDHRRAWLAEDSLHDLAQRALRQIGTPEALALVNNARQNGHGDHESDTVTITPPPPSQVPDPELDNEVSQPDTLVRQNILPQLLNQLTQASKREREDAARALAEFTQLHQGSTDPALIQPLLAHLSHDDWYIRWAMIEALAWINNPETAPALVQCLSDSSWMVRVSAISALAEMKHEASVPALAQCLADRKSRVREVAAQALGHIRSVKGVRPLRDALRDSDTFVRRMAAESLGLINDLQAQTDLLEALTDGEPAVRGAAAIALGRMEAQAAVPQLITALSDTAMPWTEEKRVCDLAAWALTAINTPEARRAVDQWRAS